MDIYLRTKNGRKIINKETKTPMFKTSVDKRIQLTKRLIGNNINDKMSNINNINMTKCHDNMTDKWNKKWKNIVNDVRINNLH